MKRSSWADWVQPDATEKEIARTRAEFTLGREAVPLFPVGGAFTPQSACPHNGPIPEGSAFCCMVCHDTGMRDSLALKRDPATDPKPEPDPKQTAPEPETQPAEKLTRKQRRALLNGRPSAPAATAQPD